jgi:hypothetical protein
MSGTAVDSHSSPRRTAPRVQIGASVVPEESRSRPSTVASPSPAVLVRASATPPRAVSRESTSGSAPGTIAALVPVQLTTQPTSRVVPSDSVTRSPPSGSGAASRTCAAVRVSRPEPSRVARRSAELGGIRCRSRPQCPASARMNSSRSASPRRCHSAWATMRSPSTPGRQSPVARCTRVRWSAARRRNSASVWPQSSISGIAVSWTSSACRRGSSPPREIACRVRSPRASSPVSDSTTSTMVRPVPTSSTSAGPDRARRTTSSAPGAHGSGTKNADARNVAGAHPTPGLRSPVASTTASASTDLPSLVSTRIPSPVRRIPTARTRECRNRSDGSSPNAAERVSSR